MRTLHWRERRKEKGKRVVRQKATFSVLLCSNFLDQRVGIQYVVNGMSNGGGEIKAQLVVSHLISSRIRMVEWVELTKSRRGSFRY